MLSNFFKSDVVSQSSLDAALRDRVARNAIYAQKFADRMKQPNERFLGDADLGVGRRIIDRPIYGVVHSTFKESDAGTSGTPMAAAYYADIFLQRRDELLEKYKKESQE